VLLAVLSAFIGSSILFSVVLAVILPTFVLRLLYKENQQILSKTGGGYISSGGFKDFKLPQIKGQKATYIQLYATADAICIPYMTVTWADKGKYGWVGDFGGTCGLEWYYSNVYVSLFLWVFVYYVLPGN
jgi:hypothetical protein